MDHQLVCAWLGLPSECWPPDHYRLLGLELGETDVGQIEQRVQDRLEKVRRYQLTHPELVTEAMNRLAQAFVCLTDPQARKKYNLTLRGSAFPADTTLVASSVPKPENEQIPAWREAPPPVRTVLPGTTPTITDPSVAPSPETLSEPPNAFLPDREIIISSPAADASSQVPRESGKDTITVVDSDADTATFPDLPPFPVDPVPTEATEVPEPAKASSVIEEAHAPSARRGLGTKRALYHRIARTRRLLHAWQDAGVYLEHPNLRLRRPSQATDFIQKLQDIRDALSSFPPLLGEAGQPGYAVVVLARQQAPVPVYQTLLPSQRQTLAQHWKAGHELLLTHHRFLRKELRILRKKSLLGLAARATWYVLTDQPGALLLLLALVALNMAIWRQHLHSQQWRQHGFQPPISSSVHPDDLK